jgi:hypothetical protein
MWPYWLMFFLPAWVALLVREPKVNTTKVLQPRKQQVAWISIGVLMTLLIGYRFEVGGDWGNYLRRLDSIRGLNWMDALKEGDPGYQLISWISLEFDWDIYGVNLIGGGIFSIGLVALCRRMPRPWLALAVSIPYLVVVVAMGYTRQAIALGFEMLGLVALGRKSILWFVIWIVLGATFHKTAILMLSIVPLAATRNRYWTLAWVGITAIGAYQVLLEKETENLYSSYVDAQMQSEGATIRLLMNALPATILLIWRRRFRFASEEETRFWLLLSIISIGLLGVLVTTSASTAVDRMALYLLPLQLVVYSRFPDLVGKKHKKELIASVLLYYAAVQFVWLNHAANALYWIPYRFYPLESGY